MSALEARKLVKSELLKRKLPYTQIKAKTVSFLDLARARKVFVDVFVDTSTPEILKWIDSHAKESAPPPWAPAYKEMDDLARVHGFILNFHHIVGRTAAHG